MDNKVQTKRGRIKIRSLAAELPLRYDEGWRDEAGCRGEDLSLFIYASDYPTEKQRKKLLSICNTCPVIEQCRYEGLRSMSDGWWGGMTPQERYEWAAEALFSEELQ